MESVLSRDADTHGYSRRWLLWSDQFVQPARGVNLHAARAGELASRCRAIAKVLPGEAAFTHISSAQLRAWWLPALDDSLVIACTGGQAPHLDRRGVYVRRCEIPRGHREDLDGVVVASPAWTIVELAEHLALIDLVVVIDSALQRGDVTVTDLRQTMRPGRRGVRILRRALDLVDARSESPWETVLRLLFVLAGVDVEPQYPVRNELGVQIARADLRIKGTRRLAEYDGADHRSRDQHQRDLQREKQIARLGFERFGYVAREVLWEPERIIEDATTALGQPFDPGRLALWRREVVRSSLSRVGAESLERRLARFARSSPPRSRRVAQSE